MADLQVSQLSLLVLENSDSDAQLSQTAALVLWGVESDTQLSQLSLLVLRRNLGLRIIGITD